MQRNDWHGVYAAITTKLAVDESVDLAAVAADVDFQLEARVHGIVCCGSLGEASTLTADEKLAIAATAKQASDGRAPVVLTIAEDSTRAAAALAERAAEAGIDGLMVLPAMRYLATPRETIAHFRAVAAASDCDIMVYNNPIAYGVDVTPAMLAEMADEKKFVAVKESSGDVRRLTDIHNLVGERYQLFTGVDDLALESLMLGAVGWVAGLVCAFPRETRGDLRAGAGGPHGRGARNLPLVHAAPPPRRVGALRPEHQACRAHGARHRHHRARPAAGARRRGEGGGRGSGCRGA